MEAVETQSERRVIDSLDDAPGVLVRAKPSPRHGFVRESQPAPLGAGCQLVQLLRGHVVVVEAARGPRRAAHQHARTELLQQIELPLGATQARREQVRRNRLDVERLIDLDRQTEARSLLGHPAGGPGRHDEVVLEHLHTGEARGRGGAQLVLERAGEAHGRDGDRTVARCSSSRRRTRRCGPLAGGVLRTSMNSPTGTAGLSRCMM